MHAACLCDTAKATAFETEWNSCNNLAWFQLKLWALSLPAQRPNRDLGGQLVASQLDWMSHARAQACLRLDRPISADNWPINKSHIVRYRSQSSTRQIRIRQDGGLTGNE